MIVVLDGAEYIRVDDGRLYDRLLPPLLPPLRPDTSSVEDANEGRSTDEAAAASTVPKSVEMKRAPPQAIVDAI